MSDISGDRHHRRHTSKSSHLAGGRTELVPNPETPVPRRPAIERLGAQLQTTAQSHDLRETLNTRRQPDLIDRSSLRHEQEAEPVVQEIEQLQREVEKLKKQQEFSKKWLRLRTKIRELAQELPSPAFLTENEPQPSNNQVAQAKTVHSQRSEFRRPAPTGRSARQNARKDRTASEVGES